MCRKRSASCFGAFLFDRLLEMHLQKGSVLCICSSACNLSSVSDFGMAFGMSVTVVISGVTVSVLGCRMRSSVMLCCAVLLLVWNVGPSWLVAESMQTVACLSCKRKAIRNSVSSCSCDSWAPHASSDSSV